jgi:dienelactone hydrolase
MNILTLAAALWLVGITAAVGQLTFDAAEEGRKAVERLVKGDFAGFAAGFDEKMRTALPEDKLRAAWASVQAQAGAFKNMGTPRVSTKGDYQVVVIQAEFEKATTDIQLAFNGSGQMAGFNIRPAAPAEFADAPYVSRERFSTRDVMIDAGGWPLPGVLAIPSGPGPFPAVILVHGSGPGDRDQTIGPNKPFRDLAFGLASRGVAVLRYDKRTRVHGEKMTSLLQLTVKEEVIDDVMAAVKLLRATEGVDPKRVFVLGHSLGGMLVPRIAAAAGPELGGVIVLAGAVRSLEQSIADQTRYLALADGKISPDEQPLVDEAATLVARVHALQPTDPPISFAGISAPASYWLDLRGYNPPAAALKVERPMLVLQGERDYQVTMEDFAKWKAALGGRSDVTLKSYPALNHLFIAGAGPSAPAEYMTPGHVSEEVVRDIGAWVMSGKLPAPQ